jgi:hypothetical protein
MLAWPVSAWTVGLSALLVLLSSAGALASRPGISCGELAFSSTHAKHDRERGSGVTSLFRLRGPS